MTEQKTPDTSTPAEEVKPDKEPEAPASADPLSAPTVRHVHRESQCPGIPPGRKTWNWMDGWGYDD